MSNETNIEENIKFIEKMIEEYRTFRDLDNPEFEETEKICKVIKSILADRVRLKKENENWEKYNLEVEEEITQLNNKLFEAEAKANKYDSLVEKIKEKIEELDKISKKKDIIQETVKEEKLDGSYVYSQRFNADGYIAEAIINVLQGILYSDEEEKNNENVL